mmetsp:Transcript_122243/g.182645  ORF Transcript_122243/g.182645 Transcript_122243/m.182645 type:complete len:212 (-) Transcript_122243:705-1340(-)
MTSNLQSSFSVIHETASWPFSATTVSCPRRESILQTTFWFTLLSSATKMRKLIVSWFDDGSRMSVASCWHFVTMPSGISNQNVAPFPSSESTPIVPPMLSTSDLQIASPSPVPPKLRDTEASACWYGLKIRSHLSFGIPMPLSFTLKRIVIWSSSFLILRLSKTISPFFVNFTAFDNMFNTICRNRFGSPSSLIGIFWSTLHVTVSPFSCT